jgi:hypothetical protein
VIPHSTPPHPHHIGGQSTATAIDATAKLHSAAVEARSWVAGWLAV